MRQKPILMTTLISAALLLGGVAPAMANSPRQGPQPPAIGEQLQLVLEETLADMGEGEAMEVDEALEEGAPVDAEDAGQAALDNDEGKNHDKGNKPDKAKKHKKKCLDFAHPCEPKELYKRMPAIPMTDLAAASTSGDVVPRWFYLVNGLSTQSQPLVLTDASANAANGALLTIAPVQPGLQGQVWRADALGGGLAFLSSGLGNTILLSYSGGCTNAAPAIMYNSQESSPTSGADGFQKWNFAKAGTTTVGGEVVSLVTIGNATCAGTLFVDQQTNGNSVLIGSSGAAPGNRWFAWPNYPLDTILNEPALQFPTGSTTDPDQKTAYTYINSQLSPPPPSTCTFENGYTYTGLRCAYTSVPADMTGYQTTLQIMVALSSTYASYAGVPVDTFYQVAKQLETEVGDVIVVNNLFNNGIDPTFSALAIGQTDGLNQYLNDVLGSTTATNNVKATTAAFVNGMLYTVLSAGPGPLGVFANLMETAVNTTEAATQDQVQLGNPFQVAADELWTQLNTEFKGVLTATTAMQTAIVSDWGMLQNVVSLTVVSPLAPGSLNWQDDTESMVVSQGDKGWAIVSMQTLLPARYQLYRLTSQANGDSITSYMNDDWGPNPPPPWWAQYSNYIATQQNTSYQYQLWDLYFIGDGQGNFPLQQALETDVFNNGGSAYDLFTNTNGWTFTMNDFYLNCWGALTTLTNWTGNELTVTATPEQGLLGGNGSSLYVTPGGNTQGQKDAVTYSLPAYGSLTIGSSFDNVLFGGMEIFFQVWDNAFSTSETVISFDTHQHSCHDTDATWVDPIYYANPPSTYRYTTPAVTTQSGSNPGYISVGIYLE